MNIGLKRGTVILLEHQEDWEKAGKECAKLLSSILGESAVGVQHVGSTSIPGIHAKPIIDIAVGARTLDEVPEYREELSKYGIIFHGEDIPGQLLFVMGNGDIRTHHIHFVTWNGEAWWNYILFRDYLCTHPEKAKAYDELKMSLAMEYPNDRKAYTNSKDSFIKTIITEARKMHFENRYS